MKSIIGRNWLIIVLILIGIVVPVHWFADGRLIAGGDHISYYNPSHIFFDYYYLWLDSVNFGDPNMSVAYLFPFLSFFKIFQVLGFTPLISEIAWMIYLFLFPGLTMFLLVRELLTEKISWRTGGALAAAIYYMFNPYIMTDMIQISLRPVHVALPLLLFLWYRGLSNNRRGLVYSVLFSLATLLVASSGASPAYLVVIPLTIFAFTLFWALSHKQQLLPILVFAARTVFFSGLLNLWWLVPAFLFYSNMGTIVQKSLSVSDFTRATPLWESLRLMGFWAFRINWDNLPHIPYAAIYYQAPFLLISFSITALAFAGLLIKPRRFFPVFFGLLFLLGAFISKGANDPLGGYYEFIFERLPIFSIFREPFTKFTTLSLFSLAVLVGLSWGK